MGNQILCISDRNLGRSVLISIAEIERSPLGKRPGFRESFPREKTIDICLVLGEVLLNECQSRPEVCFVFISLDLLCPRWEGF